MRTLNLSRLARASESSFFNKEQATQAQNIRKTLSPSEISACKPLPTKQHSPDVLPEIAAHSAYKTLVRKSLHDAPARHAQSRILTRLADSIAIKNVSPGISQPPLHSQPQPQLQHAAGIVDASVLRALGPARLSVYREVTAASQTGPDRSSTVRELPGSSRYAEGAVLGIASLSTATAVVASVGFVGLFTLWYNPGIVDRWREGTIAFNGMLDRHVGRRMREAVDRRRAKGSLLSNDTRDKVSAFARSASGLSEPVPDVRAERT